MPRMADLMAMLRNAAREFGADTPITRLPLDRDTAPPNTDPSSYESATRNPVIGHGNPALLIRLGPDGTMKLEAVAKGDTDVHREDMKKMYTQRKKDWAEFSAQQEKRINNKD